MMGVVKNKKNFKFILLLLSFFLLLLAAFTYYHYIIAKNNFRYDIPCKIQINYCSFCPSENMPLIDEDNEEVETIWNKTKAIILQGPVNNSLIRVSHTLTDFSFKFQKGNKIQMIIYSGLVLNDKNSKETKFILSFNNKYYLSQDLSFIVDAMSQISLRSATLKLINSPAKVTIFCDKSNEAQTYRKHEVTKFEREKLINALEKVKVSPLFGGPETVLSGKAPPYPFYSIEIKRNDLTVNINWLEENYDYLRITFVKSGKLVNVDESSKTLCDMEHNLLKVCEGILPVEKPKPPDIRYFFLADSAKLTKENMGIKDMQISQKEIYCILKTIFRKGLNPVEVNDDVPMVIEFKTGGSTETMKIGSDYVECFGKHISKPYILFYASHCLK